MNESHGVCNIFSTLRLDFCMLVHSLRLKLEDRQWNESTKTVEVLEKASLISGTHDGPVHLISLDSTFSAMCPPSLGRGPLR